MTIRSAANSAIEEATVKEKTRVIGYAVMIAVRVAIAMASTDTADPANVYSCRNFLKAGYTFHSRKQKYGGLVRDIYCKEIKKA